MCALVTTAVDVTDAPELEEPVREDVSAAAARGGGVLPHHPILPNGSTFTRTLGQWADEHTDAHTVLVFL